MKWLIGPLLASLTTAWVLVNALEFFLGGALGAALGAAKAATFGGAAAAVTRASGARAITQHAKSSRKGLARMGRRMDRRAGRISFMDR